MFVMDNVYVISSLLLLSFHEHGHRFFTTYVHVKDEI